MGKQAYKTINLRPESLALVDTMNTIVDEYIDQGFRLTVRQLYYQLVARAVVENTEQSYKRITGIVNDAKLAGLMDWEAIEDRTREFVRRTRWAGAAEILEASSASFHMDMWADQDTRVFVVVEKEALVGVLEGVCNTYDVPLLAARGYPSGTVLREFCVSDVLPYAGDQAVRILHLGDHDPSGIDMTRDLTERVELFSEMNDTGGDVDLTRIALTMDQIQQQKPPPNPAKTTDSRFAAYMREYGSKSWELDALKPEYLSRLVARHIQQHIDQDKWDARKAEIEGLKKKIRKLAATFK